MNYTQNRKYLQRVLKTFSLTFVFLTAILTIVWWILGPGFLSPPSIFIISLFISLFIAAHITRGIQIIDFEIGSHNRDPRIGLPMYREEIEKGLSSLSYNKTGVEDDWDVYSPRPRYQTMDGKIYIKQDSYSIFIRGPRGTVKILSSFLDLNKILL